jgi:hypothetical protein
MSDLAAGLLLLSNMTTPVMFTAPGNPSTTPHRPLAGHLHEIAVTRCSAPDAMEWRRRNVTRYAPDTRPVFGRPGHGKGALVKRQVLAEAMRSWPTVAVDPSREYVVFDELAGCKPLRLSGSMRVLDPLAITLHTVWSPVADGSAGEW